MPARAPRRLVQGPRGTWLLGSLWVWVLCGLGMAGSLGTPQPCQAPQQWEGRQVLYQQSSGHNNRALVSYDGLNQRVRVLDERKALIPCKRLSQTSPIKLSHKSMENVLGRTRSFKYLSAPQQPQFSSQYSPT
eukprot:XP_006516581.1 PREDICTED: mammalian ependymin-related protein 1 isoform X1 [Mus musculus]